MSSFAGLLPIMVAVFPIFREQVGLTVPFLLAYVSKFWCSSALLSSMRTSAGVFESGGLNTAFSLSVICKAASYSARSPLSAPTLRVCSETEGILESLLAEASGLFLAAAGQGSIGSSSKSSSASVRFIRFILYFRARQTCDGKDDLEFNYNYLV